HGGAGALTASLGADTSLIVSGVVSIDNLNASASAAGTKVTLGTSPAATVSVGGLSIRTGAGDINTTLNGAVTVNGTMASVHASGDSVLNVNDDLHVTGSLLLAGGNGASVTAFAPG